MKKNLIHIYTTKICEFECSCFYEGKLNFNNHKVIFTPENKQIDQNLISNNSVPSIYVDNNGLEFLVPTEGEIEWAVIQENSIYHLNESI